MRYHVTFRSKHDDAVRITRVHETSRAGAIRLVAAQQGIPQQRVLSAVAIPTPRSVTPYPETLTPGQG